MSLRKHVAKSEERSPAVRGGSGQPPGALLRAAREAAGVTQAEMGRRLGSSQQAVAQAERPESNPTMRFLSEWARALDLELDVILRGRSERSDRRNGR